MKVLIDTSAFMALILKDESFHEKVLNQYKVYKKNRAQLITSEYVLDELYTRCVYRAGSHGAKLATNLIKEAVTSNELAVLEVDSNVFRKAESVFLKFSDHKISFTDATSYVLFKDFSLDEIFTLDDDFKRMRLSTSFQIQAQFCGFIFSRTGANDLEPLLESILAHWKPLDIDYTSVILNQINATRAQTNAGELYYQ